MGLLGRLSNPVWNKVSKLDTNRQRIVATVICSYGHLRQAIEEELVAPVESVLKASGIVPTAMDAGLSAESRAQLRDEALVGLLRCCKCPASDPSGRLPAKIVNGLAELWGACALADINHRLKRPSPMVLDQTHYSRDSDEARTQVLTKWMQILGVAAPSFVSQANACGFAGASDSLVNSFIAGALRRGLRECRRNYCSRKRGALQQEFLLIAQA